MTDKEIIELLEKRDETVLRELEKRYYPYCFTIAFNILGNPDDVIEVINDSFLDIWNSIPPAHPERLSSYLASVVRHNAINVYKKLHNMKNEAVSTALPLEAAEYKTYSVDETINRIVITDLIDKFLDTLPEKQNLIFVARFYFDESIEEISEKFNIPAGSVKSIIHRLKKKLKAFMDKEGIYL